jgi:hypothetical protein
MDRFAAFLKKMAETNDGDGSLLDHSIFLYGSNMGNSDKHSNWPIPDRRRRRRQRQDEAGRPAQSRSTSGRRSPTST